MQVSAGHCDPAEDPLNICYAQASAYCSNHTHGGGGGVQLLEPVFTIEDRDDGFAVTMTFDLSDVGEHQRRSVREAVTLGAEDLEGRQRSMAARLRLLIDESGAEYGAEAAD